jgi:hypothetical protein
MENVLLKNRILDLELKERDYVTKIINLETTIAQNNLDQSTTMKNMKKTSIMAGRENNMLEGLATLKDNLKQ